ncbi:heparin lyase I family protein [Niallia sp. FSL W8-0635]|uniref:heparin lyase I family protein n=1 Tax=Niallia sp. FSL W8-0635 TaxID=2975337 RepID=UPI0030FA5E63
MQLKKKIITLLFVCIFFVYLFIAYANKSKTEEVTLLDFEDAIKNKYSVISNGNDYQIQGIRENVSLELNQNNNDKYIKFNLSPGENRSELRIFNIPNNQSKHVAFRVFIPTDNKTQDNWNIFAQWWQGKSVSPAISFELIPTDNNFSFRILSRNGNSENYKTTFHYSKEIEKGKWIDFVIEMRIDDKNTKNGLLKVWKNGSTIVSYTGKLGYSDQNDYTNFRVGLYRSSSNNSIISLYFDKIKLWDTIDNTSS